MKFRFEWLLLLSTLGLYVLFFVFNQPVDYEVCQLCDGKQYLKLYWYFESGTASQLPFPFYTRPVVPFLASLIPGDDPVLAFHAINAIFMVLALVCIRNLWNYLDLKDSLQWVGFGWLLLHWTGIIRYNLFDYVTVDVPLYFVQALALLLFFRRKYRWFYILTPLAMLQKESFLAVMVGVLAMHILEARKGWFIQGKHLLFPLIAGVFIQKLVMVLLPEQMDQRNSLLAILWHANLVLEDPLRLIRWFAAFGSAFGILPFIILFKMKKQLTQENTLLTLLILSLMYCAFGILAGEDMTRILFLGFPFIMTFTLLLYQSESYTVLLIAVTLSLASLRIVQIPIENRWGVDYREMSYVFDWAIYHAIAVIVFVLARIWLIRQKKSPI